MKKILFVVNEFNSANGICCDSVMRACAENGYDVYCVTEASCSVHPNYAHFYYVKPRLFQKLQMLNSKYSIPGFSLFNRILNKLLLFFTIPVWPLLSPLYVLRLYKKVLRICVTTHMDYVVPVYTQIDTLIVASMVKRKLSYIKSIPYFLDSLSGGYGPRFFSKKWIVQRGLRWERLLLKNADAIVAMESSRHHHEIYSVKEKYYNKFIFLDLPLFNLKNVKSNSTEEKKIFAYVGTLPKGIRSPKFIVEALSNIESKNVEFWFVGEKNCTILNEKTNQDSRFKIMGRVSHLEACRIMEQADVLINIGNTNANMTPCKIFEYMSMGKKIISTYPIPNEPSLVYLKKYEASLLLDESSTDMEHAANKIYEHAMKQNFFVDEKKMNEVFYKNTPYAFLTVLNNV